MKLTLFMKPLSLNNCFRGRRFDTSIKKMYDATLQFTLPKEKVIADYYKVTFRFGLKRCFAGDLDNLCKVLLDNIVDRGIISSDKKVVEIHLFKRPADVDQIEITVEPAAMPEGVKP
jgi:Holliday junction resolvase RusA-like endonuclease